MAEGDGWLSFPAAFLPCCLLPPSSSVVVVTLYPVPRTLNPQATGGRSDPQYGHLTNLTLTSLPQVGQVRMGTSLPE